jgi:hypothetical protein
VLHGLAHGAHEDWRTIWCTSTRNAVGKVNPLNSERL